MIKNRELEIYIHIPFCVKKCAYCDFLSAPATESSMERYVTALVKELHTHHEAMKACVVKTIFVGGGTPSILSESQLERIFKAICENFTLDESAEITIEANPGTVTREKLLCYRQVGINRISFGLQSANNEELKTLGRIHSYEAFLESFHMARECGFENINVDLISAVPNQTIQSWEETLRKIVQLNPEHISAYSLIVEEGTPFANLYGEGGPNEAELPSEDEERRMYQRTKELLEEFGYHQYEISNYAKEGRECRHNLGYWERKEYLGVGLGSASLIGNQRYKNTDSFEKYLKHSDEFSIIQEECQTLSVQEQKEEFIFLGLRKTKGVLEEEFQDMFGQSIETCYGTQIERFERQGLLQRKEGRLSLTKEGIHVSNYIFSEFLA